MNRITNTITHLRRKTNGGDFYQHCNMQDIKDARVLRATREASTNYAKNYHGNPLVQILLK